jgi:hypothetical protein
MSDSLDILQTLRIKGLADPDEIAAALGAESVETVLPALAERGFIAPTEGSSKWILTPEGLAEQGRLATELSADGPAEDLRLAYEVFLDLNAPVKELVSDWQAGDQSEAQAGEILEELAEIHQHLGEGMEIGSRSVPRLNVYTGRLGAALDKVRAGDLRFLADPTIPSFHTVWFECHEDLLLLLGKTRAEEE